MLSFYISAEHTNWDTFLPYLTSAYNTASQFTRGYTLFRLLYGHEAICTIDIIFLYARGLEHVTLAGASGRSDEHWQIARFRTFDSRSGQAMVRRAPVPRCV